MKYQLYALRFFLLLFVLMPTSSFAQEVEEEEEIPPVTTRYLEIKDDDFIPVDRDGMPTSPAITGQNDQFFYTQVNINNNGDNIIGDAGNEPSIAVDPTNPNRMVIGWRQFDDINNNFRQAGFAYTNDGGQNWTFPGVIEPGIFRSDPVLAADSEGNFHYNSLTVDFSTNDYTCDQFVSTGDGTWDGGTFAQGGDKQWMTIDNSGGEGDGHIYEIWNVAFSTCSPGHFTRSTDDNFSFESCTSLPGEPFWGTLAVGPEGELYASGTNFAGEVLIGKSTSAKVADQPMSWDFVTSTTLGGGIASFGGQNSPNPSGLHGQIWVDVDRSGGINNGNVYALATVAPFSNSDPSDVMFIRSSDGGETWSTPIKINDDNQLNNWQWLGTMSVAPNGRIDAVWLDTRIFPNTFLSQLYYSFSEDGGLTWSPNEALVDQVFDPHVGWPSQEKMGDYFHMVSDDEGANLAWAATFEGEQNVYYGRISNSTVSTQNPIASNGTLLQNFPNPFHQTTSITYALKTAGQIRLTIKNELGQTVKILVDEKQSIGDYTVEWDGRSNNSGTVGSGVYFYELSIDNRVSTTKRMVFLQ